MIVGRAAELRVLDELFQGLLRADGGALIVHGEPGIGKTTLLDALVERCGDEVTVLRGGGAETEAELAFALLADVLYPVLGERGTLPAPQEAALAGALALGPPAPGDRLAVCVAVLGVLRAAAARRPVLAVVDDIQWADSASRESIEYIARRAGGRLAVVLAARDPWDGIERMPLPTLDIGPVDDRSAIGLLRAAAPDLAVAGTTSGTSSPGMRGVGATGPEPSELRSATRAVSTSGSTTGADTARADGGHPLPVTVACGCHGPPRPAGHES
jgi:AAA ATPase domain